MPVSAEKAIPLKVIAGPVVSRTYACGCSVPERPARLVTRTFKVLLAVSVCPASDHVFCPTVEVAVVHVPPLSRETSTISPLARLALSVPLMVCAAVFVMKSELETPVSAEKVTVATVVVVQRSRERMPGF